MRIFHSKLWVAVMLATCVNLEANAGITTDTSLGHASQTLTGNMTIDQTMGKLQGNNLFHSFQTFNINTGESATFTYTTTSIANVISRVTGGSASTINGALTLTANGGSPNFFLINPAGVTFGAGAFIDVPGAFHVSTADYVKFADGKYYADLTKASTLSVATPDAFGFLGNPRASITVNGGAILTTLPTQPISVIAGDVTLDNGTVSTLSGGDIRVAAVGQTAVEIPFSGPLPAAYGDLTIINGGNITANTATSDPAGSVDVSAGNIIIDGNGINDGFETILGISSTNFLSGDGAAGNVNVKATGNISLANGAVINADTYSTGSAGNVTVEAGSVAIDGNGSVLGLILFNSSRISSISFSGGNTGAVNVTAKENITINNFGYIGADSVISGDAGPVTVTAGSINIDGYGITSFTGISSNANPGGALGKGGDISITTTAGDISLLNNGQIISSTYGVGDSGSITVKAAGNISLVNNGQITSSTFGAGNTGSVKVNAGSISVDGLGSLTTGISTDAYPNSDPNVSSTGKAGTVTITTGDISLINGGYLRSTSHASGNAGNVNIAKAGNISIINGGDLFSNCYASGNAGIVNINAGNITIDGQGNVGYDFTGITSQAFQNSTGNAGKVSITTTGNISLSNAGLISTSTFASGDAGLIDIHAGNININGSLNTNSTSTQLTGIASDAEVGSTRGNAGTINVTTSGLLSLINVGQISSNTWSTGKAGSINVTADKISIDGKSKGRASGFLTHATSSSAGQTGNIDVTANKLTISNGGEISIRNDAHSETPSALTPTNIKVAVPVINILNSLNAITASSTDNIEAGSIYITASNELYLDPSGITTTANLGNGGGISITAGILSLNNSEITTSVTGSTGNGGNISITAKSLLLNTGFIQANTAAANASGGTITIDAQSLLPSGNVLFIGGNTPYAFKADIFGFNVIQAAAPTGISGTPQTTAPTLDLSSSLSGLNTQQIDTGGLGRSPCQATGGSSLASAGRGGLARGLLRAELPLPANKTGYIPQANGREMHLALTDWSCS